jgi:hypothetical protein
MSPLAKALRTFAALSVGVLGTAALYDWATDARTGAIALGLGLATAALGGIVAGLYAMAGRAASSPVGKAVNTLWQGLAAGLATVAFNSVADLVAFPRLAWPVLIGAALGALQTLAQTTAEP